MIWAKEETMSRAEIEAIQLSRLKDTVNRVYEKVPAYRAKMEEAGVRPEHIQTLKDLQKLPFVTKQDMRDNYPYGLFAVPKKELRRIHASSGTTGKPTVVGYTENDLEVWKECVARLAVARRRLGRGCGPDFVWMTACSQAPGTHNGLEKVGAAVVPSSTGNTPEAADVYEGFLRPPLLVATPLLCPCVLLRWPLEMGIKSQKKT